MPSRGQKFPDKNSWKNWTTWYWYANFSSLLGCNKLICNAAMLLGAGNCALSVRNLQNILGSVFRSRIFFFGRRIFSRILEPDLAKASFSAYVLVNNLLKTGERVHFSTKKCTTNFGRPFCFFPFPYFCFKMAKICCFCLAKAKNVGRKRGLRPGFHLVFLEKKCPEKSTGIILPKSSKFLQQKSPTQFCRSAGPKYL